jgi:hypothetical protein
LWTEGFDGFFEFNLPSPPDEDKGSFRQVKLTWFVSLFTTGLGPDFAPGADTSVRVHIYYQKNFASPINREALAGQLAILKARSGAAACAKRDRPART